MKLTDILTPECIVVPMAAADKTTAITELVDRLAAQGRIQNRDVVLKAVIDREMAASTGIGMGLAVPHGKSPGSRELVMAIGKPATPLDFDSKDGKPVDLIVLLTSAPDKTGPHIQALARVSRLMLNEGFRRDIARADAADEIWKSICRYEDQATIGIG